GTAAASIGEGTETRRAVHPKCRAASVASVSRQMLSMVLPFHSPLLSWGAVVGSLGLRADEPDRAVAVHLADPVDGGCRRSCRPRRSVVVMHDARSRYGPRVRFRTFSALGLLFRLVTDVLEGLSTRFHRLIQLFAGTLGRAFGVEGFGRSLCGVIDPLACAFSATLGLTGTESEYEHHGAKAC
ncbi:MAG: hypothetical protein ACREA0_31850, partial [bacterium]